MEVDEQQHNQSMINTNQRGNRNQQQRFITSKAFWQEFLEKNLKYQTVPAGGNNPVFIPFVTNEQTYEDKYVHNEAQHL